MASQYPIEPRQSSASGAKRVYDIRLITEPDQVLLDTLNPDTPPDVPVYVEVSLDGVPRGTMALAGITRDGVDRLAILGMIGAPGFVDIALQVTMAIAKGLELDGAVAEAMTPAHGRLYRRALRRIGGVLSDGQ